VQAPPGTRAVDDYNNSAPYPLRPQRQGSTITHSTVAASTIPSMYPPSSNTPTPVAAQYDPSPDNHYNHDPYSPQAYGHNSDVQQPYDAYGAFSPATYNATAIMAPPQTSYGPHPSRSPTLQPDRNAYVTNTTPVPTNDPYSDPYYGHYQSASNPTPPPMSRSPGLINTQVTGIPTSVSPVRGPKGPRTSIVMAPPAPSVQYSDSPPTYESTPYGAPGWGRRG